MNILVIGNGFDLAHGLPTKYENFLKFINTYRENRDILKNEQSIKEKLENYDGENKNYLIFLKNLSEKKAVFSELDKLIKNNIWIEYFLSVYRDRKKAGKDGWIDFERGISEVIQSLDNDMHGLSGEGSIDDDISLLSNNFFDKKYFEYSSVNQSFVALTEGEVQTISFREIRNVLLNDLNKLIRALEIYLTAYVNEVQCNEELSIIKNIFEKRDEQGKKIVINTKILSFNYTTTFNRIYKQNFDIDYIHGEAKINNTIETNNMVLGIDEYLPKKRKNKETEFIAFKKFYQRIHKGTGCKYKEWIDIIKEEFADYQVELEKSKKEKNVMNLKAAINKLKKQYLSQHHVYIFGHSLDVTDKDILRDLILNDNVYTTIYYHNKDAMGQQIANLVKVIGQDELIRRTGGSTKTIEFKQQ